MADGVPFQTHFLSMASLGRCLKLGDLYDYRRDETVTGKRVINKMTCAIVSI